MIHPHIQLQEDSVILTHPEQIPGGTVAAIPSKSHAHRLLIAAALSDAVTLVRCPVTSKDIDATAGCLEAMGAKIERTPEGFLVHGLRSGTPARLSVGESGSTLRFLLPVLGALGITAELTMEGRLPSRPLSPLYEEMCRHGVTLSPQGTNPLRISGQLSAGEYRIDGGVSSQYITGLLLALPNLPEDSRLVITGRLESRPYVDITLRVLRQFGIRITEGEETEEGISTIFEIPGSQAFLCQGHPSDDRANKTEEDAVTSSSDSPCLAEVEGDWSNAAFFLAAGALLPNPVTVTGCDLTSPQGDKTIVSLLQHFGARIDAEPSETDDSTVALTVSGGTLQGITIDAADIPDLVPILSVVAAYAEGTTVIRNIERLRIKESDRVATVTEMLTRLGAVCTSTESELRIEGSSTLPGGTVSSHNDHRIAMAAAIASLRTEGPVKILQPMAVAKSYPGFYEDLSKLLG